MVTGRVLNIQNYSVNDGEGVRTILFLAGCPLRCRWCANPEGLSSQNRIFYNERLCTHCGKCAAVCPCGVGMDLSDPKMRLRCKGCGKCVAVCPMGARKNTVTVMTAEEAAEKLMEHLVFFEESNGGVTYSGGECTMQADFLDALSRILYDEGISQAIETSAYFDFDRVKPILARMDRIFMDCKLFARGQHRYYTGRYNDRILENIRKTAALGIPMVVRVPVIRGVNDSESNIRATADFVRDALPRPQMEFLPCHSYGLEKYRQLGLRAEEAAFERPSDRWMDHLKDVARREGVDVVSYL